MAAKTQLAVESAKRGEGCAIIICLHSDEAAQFRALPHQTPLERAIDSR